MVEKTWALPSWSPAIVKMMMVYGRQGTSLVPKRKAGNRNVVLVAVIMGANIVIANILRAVQVMVP